MALASSSSTSFSYYSSSIRYPVVVRTSSTAHLATTVTNKKHVSFAAIAETLPPPPPVFEIPHTTLDLFLRSEMFALAKRDTPPANLVLNDVPPAALPAIRLYFETAGKHVKYIPRLLCVGMTER